MYGFYDDKSKADINSIGEIKAFGGSVAPEGWRICNGDVISRTDYSELFGVIGTTYGGGDGSNTFAIPDFRGRTAIGAGENEATGHTAHALGQSGGEESHSLTVGEMPSHSHAAAWGAFCYSDQGAFINAGGIPGSGTRKYVTTVNTAGTISWQGSTGGAYNAYGSAHNVMQPYTTINYIIYTGVA